MLRKTRITALSAMAATAALLAMGTPAFADDPGSPSSDPIAAGPVGSGDPDNPVIYYSGAEGEDDPVLYDGEDCVESEICTTSIALPVAPVLSQSSAHGLVLLRVTTKPELQGQQVNFYVRSASGKVRSAGAGIIHSNGTATHVLHQRAGQILRIYAKVIKVGPAQLAFPYTSDVAFKVH